ncbi:AEC family transporter [Fibrella forsythiae]|uniref:AEC family transporter n=1 Tax=Fibrella forsythiae TaxID=2817061 RepID=A0ABS3JNU7_9BACT|nr:AEC family transporter [Fibrella forsythiae]MBO0951664.1 AEC family transporter [Fibrella forsythiae]
MEQANLVFLVTLCIVGLGFSLKHWGIISEQNGKVVSRLLMHTTFPALMVVSTIHVPLTANLLAIPFASIAIGSMLVLLAWFIFAKQPARLRGGLTIAVGAFNIGMFGFPIIEGIWGRDALVYAVLYDIGNTIVIFGIIYPVGYYFASGGVNRPPVKAMLRRMLRLPPLLGMVLGLMLNVLSLDLPPVLFNTLDTLAKANKPLVLLLLGIYLSFELEKSQQFSIFRLLALRYAGCFAALFLLYALLPDSSLLRTTLTVCVLLPVGMTVLPFSDEFNFDSRVAGTLVNLSLVISFGLLWLMVSWLGLV